MQLVFDCVIVYKYNGVSSSWFPDRWVLLHRNNLGLCCLFSKAVQMWHQRTNGTALILSPIDCGIPSSFLGICHSCVGGEKMFLHFCHSISNVSHSGFNMLTAQWVQNASIWLLGWIFIPVKAFFFFLSNMKITQFWTLLPWKQKNVFRGQVLKYQYYFFRSCITCWASREHFHDELDLGLSACWMQLCFPHFECVASYLYSPLFIRRHWISSF